MGDVEVDLVGDLGALNGLCRLCAEERSEGHDNESYTKTTEHVGMKRRKVREIWPTMTSIYVAA